MSFAPPPHPYPADRYTGQGGELSARLRRAGSTPELVNPNGGSCEYLVTGASSNGDFGLYRWNMGPGQGGPDEHLHKAISESFFVLDGTIKIFDGTIWNDCRPGDFCYVPEGGVHGFRNESGEPASMLILFAPGAPRERYFEGLAELATLPERPSAEEMAEFYRRHDTFWLARD